MLLLLFVSNSQSLYSSKCFLQNLKKNSIEYRWNADWKVDKIKVLYVAQKNEDFLVNVNKFEVFYGFVHIH